MKNRTNQRKRRKLKKISSEMGVVVSALVVLAVITIKQHVQYPNDMEIHQPEIALYDEEDKEDGWRLFGNFRAPNGFGATLTSEYFCNVIRSAPSQII